MKVKAKKHLGQHFLKDASICQRIVECIDLEKSQNVLEIGSGTGALTKWLIEKKKIQSLHLMDIDQESIAYLNQVYPELSDRIHFADFLHHNIDEFL